MFVFRQAMVMCFFGSVLMKHVLVKTKDRRVGRNHARYKGHVTDGKNPFGHYRVPDERNHFGDYRVSDAGKNKFPGVGKLAQKLLNDKAIKKMIKNVADKGELPSIGDAVQAVLNSKAIKDLPAIKDLFQVLLPGLEKMLGNGNGNDYMDYGVFDSVKKALSGIGEKGKELLKDDAIKKVIRDIADKGELPSAGDVVQAVLNSKAVKDMLG